jgi:hypothetical protein
LDKPKLFDSLPNAKALVFDPYCRNGDSLRPDRTGKIAARELGHAAAERA